MNFKIISVGVSCLLAICYLFQQYYYTPEIPFGDDLPTIYDFLLHFEEAQSIPKKLAVLFNNHFLEHRLVPSTLITVLFYSIFDTVYLPLLTLTAGLFWVSLLGFYYQILKNFLLSPAWLLTITCVLLCSAAYQTMYWPMAALQHFLVIFFVVATINLLCSKPDVIYRRFVPAVLLACLATFASGNGMAVWPAGLLVLLVRREFKLGLYWSACMGLAVYIYFWNFTLTGSPSNTILQRLFDHSFHKFIAFLAGLGAAIHFGDLPYFFEIADVPFSLKYPEIYVGLVMVILFVWLFKRSLANCDLTILSLLCILIFIFISFGLIVLGRYSNDLFITIFKSRYYPYSIIAFCNTICLVAYTTRSMVWHRWLLRISVAGSIVFWIFWQYVAYSRIVNHNNIQQAGFFNWQQSKNWIIYQPTAYYELFYNYIFNKMEKAESSFRPDQTSLTVAFKAKEWTTSGFVPMSFLTIQRKNDKIEIRAQNDLAAPIQSMKEGYALVMASKVDTFLLWSTINRAPVRSFLTKGQLCGSGYKVETSLNQSMVPTGTYSFYQFRYSEGRGFISKTSCGVLRYE